MHQTGLLILTRPFPILKSAVQGILEETSSAVSKTLYVHIQPFSGPSKEFTVCNVPCSKDFRYLMTQFYSAGAKLCSSLDVRILLNHVTNLPKPCQGLSFKKSCDIILIDNSDIAEQLSNNSESLTALFKPFHGKIPLVQKLKVELESESTDPDLVTEGQLESYKNVVLGGTFDRIHTGHKIMLTEGCFLAEKQLTVGVTEQNMNQRKTLCELITPTPVRIQGVKEFLTDIKPYIEHRVVPISDMFGPTITDPELEYIVVSEETKKGGDMVNEERKKKGFSTLKQHVIELVEDACHNQYEEEKISSSSLRKRLLGTVINPIKENNAIPARPYVIGLTGGIASGKSSLCARLEKLGAGVVDCDKLGHEVYLKGTACFDRIVKEFGEEIVREDGEIQRRSLGSIVFSNPDKLKLLNSIVWPEIARLAEEKIKQFGENGKEVIILEAALLLDAGWNSLVHEVWTSVIPPAEAVKRMQDRNNLSEEEANKRLKTQLSNQERVDQSNVVLCTLWEYEYTQTQVEKAWALLQDRLRNRQNEQSKY